MSYVKTDNLDLNAKDAVSDFISVRDDTSASAQVSLTTGSISAFVVAVEGTIDQSKWLPTGTTITAEGITSPFDVTAYGNIRARVTTANGGACTCSLSLLSKKA